MANPMAGSERLEVKKVREQFPAGFLGSKEYRGDTFIFAESRDIVKIIEFIKNDPDLDYSYFAECVGVDYSAWNHDRDLSERFEVIYNLFSLKHNSRIFIKVGVNDGTPIPTLKNVFAGAEYPEREIQDLYGIPFSGNEENPGMRFMLPDDWVGYPLRKEVPLGGEDVVFAHKTKGPAIEDRPSPHAGESWEGKTGTGEVSGR